MADLALDDERFRYNRPIIRPGFGKQETRINHILNGSMRPVFGKAKEMNI